MDQSAEQSPPAAGHVAPQVRPVRRGTLPASIAEQLRDQIRRGQLRPGDQLPGHRELAASFSVSVGSVREAISMLVSEGLVVTQAGRGTYVAADVAEPPGVLPPPPSRPLEADEVAELTEAREVIESELAAMAAERATPAQVADLEAALKGMEAAAADPIKYGEADVEFHLVLARASGNRYLLQAMVDVRSLLRQDMELGAEAAIRRFGDLQYSVDSHRKLTAAVKKGEADAARDVMLEMVRRNHEFVLALYALGSETSSSAAG